MRAVKVNVPQVFYVDVKRGTMKKNKQHRKSKKKVNKKLFQERKLLFFLWLLLPASNIVIYIRMYSIHY